MVIGTSEGFQKDLQLIGVGYRGAVAGKKLTMNLGYSHPVEMEIPHDVEVKVNFLQLGLESQPSCTSEWRRPVYMQAHHAHISCRLTV